MGRSGTCQVVGTKFAACCPTSVLRQCFHAIPQKARIHPCNAVSPYLVDFKIGHTFVERHGCKFVTVEECRDATRMEQLLDGNQ